MIPATMTYQANSADKTQLIVTLIERAIDPYNPNSNLELFFEISDLINTREENAREAFKTIRRSLEIYKGKNWAVCLKILSLLEVCSNNCNKKFQIYLANKEFLSELKHMIGPKLQPPIDIQEKVLNLIQHWATTFKADADFKPIEALYAELRSKGVDFPIYNPEMSVTNLTNTLKTTTPPRTAAQVPAGAAAAVGGGAAGAAVPNQYNQMPTIQHQMRPQTRLPDQPAMGVVKLNEEQIAKLNSELDVVESNVHILNEILNEIQLVNNSKADEDDLTLLKDLYKTCKEMQKRITQLIGSISNENIINELLRINDDLNGSFLRYERYERSMNFQKNQSTTSPSSVSASTTAPVSANSPLAAAAAAAVSAQAAKPEIRSNPSASDAITKSTASAAAASGGQPERSLIDFNDDEFDPLKSRKSDQSASSEQTSLFSKPASKIEKSDSMDDPNFEKKMLAEESEIKEMEEWLKKQELSDHLDTDQK